MAKNATPKNLNIASEKAVIRDSFKGLVAFPSSANVSGDSFFLGNVPVFKMTKKQKEFYEMMEPGRKVLFVMKGRRQSVIYHAQS